MSQANNPKVRIIPESEVGFDRAALFCESGTYAISGKDPNTHDVTIFAVSGSGEKTTLSATEFAQILEPVPGNDMVYRSRNTGRAARIMFDGTVTSPGKKDVDVKTDGFLFKSDIDGTRTFYSGADFTASFERVLCDGTRVGLLESGDIQLRKIWAAGDKSHLRDATDTFGLAAMDKGVELAEGLLRQAATSETARDARAFVADVRREAGDAVSDFKKTGQEALGNAATRVKGVLKSETAMKARQGIKKVLRWGASVSNGPK